MTSYETLVAWAMIMALAFAASVAHGCVGVRSCNILW
jgi:hypothetical protein